MISHKSARPWVVLSAGLGLALASAAALSGPSSLRLPDHREGFASISKDDLETHLANIASAPLEGRDSPSAGQQAAGDYIAGRFEAWGLEHAPGQEGFRIAFAHNALQPVEEDCALQLFVEGEDPASFELGVHFTPAPRSKGSARAELSFIGFGIRDEDERFDELDGDSLRGRIAVIVEGEPRHRSKFDGPDEVTSAADLYTKLAQLTREGVAGVIAVRRPPESDGAPRGTEAPASTGVGFRHSWAEWSGVPFQHGRVGFPVLEVSGTVATELCGFDPLELAARIDRSGRPLRVDVEGREVELSADTAMGSSPLHNIVGVIPGSDPDLAHEYVVVGAHYDHIGVDARGRVGFGADDNGSGSSGMLEIVEALATGRPSRSILACAFSGEEDGLLGSRALAQDLPIERDEVVAMINLDMIGRGDTDEVAVLGVRQNRGFEELLNRAKRLKSTRVKRIVTGQGEELFQRSDHYSFHQIRVPVMFFFEGLPISRNADYHTWRDTIDKLDIEKMLRTSRLAYNAAWILATDEERPPAPR